MVEQSGSYLDLLVKELRFELSGKYYGIPLGKNIAFLLTLKDKNTLDLTNLMKLISSFNKIVYVPAKHVYGPPNDYRHYFDVDISIIVVLYAVKLGEKIKKLSSFARNLCQDLVLPAQQKIIGNWPRTDYHGIPFDFTKKLLESKNLILDTYGREFEI